MKKKDKTIAHIKIRGNRGAIETMMRLRDVMQDEGVEITLEISSSELRSKNDLALAKKIGLEVSDD